jgi:glycosyltransferase involved in cell wall biosynthesis
MISVIIATRNRSTAIAEISLPSLLRQNMVDFEIFVWDASDDDSTERAVLQFKRSFEQKGISLSFRRGARQYLASTRNDSVREARGDVIFFLDDDAEISSDGLSAVKRYFYDFTWLKGMGLPLHDVRPRFDKYVAHPFLGAFLKLGYRFFTGKPSYRKIMNSTHNTAPIPDSPGIAEWLTGACMVYRKSVFEDLSFDEGLERFGGYAIGEDYDFSHRVWLYYGKPLLISISGFVVHHNVQAARISNGPVKAAAIYYNTARIRDGFRVYRPYKLLPFLWELRVGRTLSLLLMYGIRPLDLIRGYLKARRARREDRACPKDENIGKR